MKRIQLLLFTLWIFLASACATLPQEPATGSPTATPSELQPPATPVTSENTFPEPLQQIAEMARAQLAAALNLPVNDITILNVEGVDWPDGCLGIDYLEMACTTVIVPGYRITLEANDRPYEFRSNQDGSLLLSAELLPAPSPNPIVESARNVLAEELGIPLDQILVSSFVAVDWPDGCLGIQAPGIACMAVIVPGYQIILQANGAYHEIRTNQDGSDIRYAGPTSDITAPPILIYSVEGGIAGFCNRVEIYHSGKVNLFSCNTVPQQATLKLDEPLLNQVLAWAEQYQDFTSIQSDDAVADSMTVTLIFDGNGTEPVPDKVRQQMQDMAAEVFSSVRGPVEGDPLIGNGTPTPAGEGIPGQPADVAGLIFTNASGLWQIGSDGTPVQLSETQEAILTPSGDQIISWDGNDLWITDRATGETRNLTNTPDRVDFLPRDAAFSENSALFTSYPETAEGFPGFNGYLTMVNLDGTEYRVLDEENNVGLYALSPDGNTVAYGGGQTTWLYHLDTDARELFVPATYGIAGADFVSSPTWSPDGTQLAWLVHGNFTEANQFAVGVFNLQTQTGTILHPHQLSGTDAFSPGASWKPDGSLIAISVFDTESGKPGVWVVPLFGERPEVFVGGTNPVWSQDGGHLVVVNFEAGNLWLVDTGSWQKSVIDLPEKIFVLMDWR